jgi:hypothetical protein
MGYFGRPGACEPPPLAGGRSSRADFWDGDASFSAGRVSPRLMPGPGGPTNLQAWIWGWRAEEWS